MPLSLSKVAHSIPVKLLRVPGVDATFAVAMQLILAKQRGLVQLARFSAEVFQRSDCFHMDEPLPRTFGSDRLLVMLRLAVITRHINKICSGF
jgi:hypothetical protein